MNDPVEHCFSEARIRGLTLRNRLIKAATSLGMSEHGVPSEQLMRVHERIGEGGVGMTTVREGMRIRRQRGPLKIEL